MSIICYGAYAFAYLALSWGGGTPHVIDSYPDSQTYLPISFLGHAQRLWTVPLIYFVGGSSARAGRTPDLDRHGLLGHSCGADGPSSTFGSFV